MPARILVVDDDPQVRQVLVRFLEREGYIPSVAGSGNEALTRVQIDSPDLILLDISMSGMDGYTVCRRLKADERTALIPITIITGLCDGEARTKGIEAGADDYLIKPFDYELLRARLRSQLRLKWLTDQLERTEMVIFSMARWVEFKDRDTEEHLRRIAGYGEQVARALGLPPDQVQTVRYAGILHDIGKIGVSEAILQKPGRLAPEEQRELRKHVEHGAAIIGPLRFAPEVAPIVLTHHECWDGSGYPYGLRGEAIPIGARIIAVVDAWDAMTHDRPYRMALDHGEALRRLRAGAGSQWDPRVVECFLQLLAKDRLIPVELPGFEPMVR